MFVITLSEDECLKIRQSLALLTGTCPLMMTSSAKRTLTGLVFNFAFLAALINADLGDLENGKKQKQKNNKYLKTIYLIRDVM